MHWMAKNARVNHRDVYLAYLNDESSLRYLGSGIRCCIVSEEIQDTIAENLLLLLLHLHQSTSTKHLLLEQHFVTFILPENTLHLLVLHKSSNLNCCWYPPTKFCIQIFSASVALLLSLLLLPRRLILFRQLIKIRI
jgi:hypothetical protein